MVTRISARSSPSRSASTGSPTRRPSATFQRIRPPRSLGQRVQVAVGAAEDELLPAVGVEVGGDHPADRALQVDRPAAGIASGPGSLAAGVPGGQVAQRERGAADVEAADQAVRLGMNELARTIAIDVGQDSPGARGVAGHPVMPERLARRSVISASA